MDRTSRSGIPCTASHFAIMLTHPARKVGSHSAVERVIRTPEDIEEVTHTVLYPVFTFSLHDSYCLHTHSLYHRDMINPNASVVSQDTDATIKNEREPERVPLDTVIAKDDRASDTAVPMTDLGGNASRTDVIDENTDAPQAGAAGHPGIDEDTA